MPTELPCILVLFLQLKPRLLEPKTMQRRPAPPPHTPPYRSPVSWPNTSKAVPTAFQSFLRTP